MLSSGVSEHFDDLVAQIDASLLDHSNTIFLNQLIFDIP